MTLLLPADLHLNSSFSQRLPGLQIAVDSTSLGAFKRCPRYYYYSIICGWRPKVENVHFTFGLAIHAARELYDHLRAAGTEHDEALRQVVKRLASETWDSELSRPKFVGDSYKNRNTLLRTVIWYLDAAGAEDALQTIILANGKPAVELSFRFDSGHVSKSGEPWLLCGHIDRLVTLNDVPYETDIKTTKSELSDFWFKQFTPSNQFSLYLTAGQVVWNVPVQGIIVDGVRVLVNSSEFKRRLIRRDGPSLDEWLADTGQWLRRMEACAEEGEWPQNETACGHYASYADGGRGGCEFRDTCSRSPKQRAVWLEAEFVKRIWDPLVVRGDV